jgi:hypothetical protein
MSRASDPVSRKRRRSATGGWSPCANQALGRSSLDHFAAPTISVNYNCLLLPAIILVWWYWTKRTTQHVFQRLLITAPTCTDPSASCYDYFAHEEPSQEMTKTSTSPMPLDPFQRRQSPPIGSLCCGPSAGVAVVQPADDDDDIRVMNPRENGPFAQTAKRPFRWRRKPARESKLPGSWAANLQYHLYAAASNQPFSSWSDVVQFNDQEYTSNPHLVQWITRHRSSGDAADAISLTTGQATTKLRHDEEAAKAPLPLEMIVPTWSLQSPLSNVEVQLAPSLESADALDLTDSRLNVPRTHRVSSENDLYRTMWECIQDTTHVLGIEACI